jgi:drug/metabolite transporter (DMT)-like permease
MLPAMAAMPTPRPLLGAALLLFVSAAWGSAFPLMKDLIERIPVVDLLTERYTIAVLVLLAIRPRSLRRLSRATWAKGAALGLLFGVGQTAQAIALQDLPSAVSGFAVGCSVVMTPLLGLLFLGIRVTRRVWLAVALSTAAMAMFTLLNGAEGGEISGLALSLTLMAAGLYATHTLVLGRIGHDAYAITLIQLGTIAAMTALASLVVSDGLTLPTASADWVVLAHLGVVACALGFLGRTFGQRYVPPVPAAVIMSAQPLWVAVFALWWYGEALTWSVVTGGGLIATATLLVVCRPSAAPRPAEEAPVVQAPVAERDALLRARRMASHVLVRLQWQQREAEAREAGARQALPSLEHTHWCPDRPEGPAAAIAPQPPVAQGRPAPDVASPAPDASSPAPGRPDQVHRMVERAIGILRVRTDPAETPGIVPLVVAVDGLDLDGEQIEDVLGGSEGAPPPVGVPPEAASAGCVATVAAESAGCAGSAGVADAGAASAAVPEGAEVGGAVTEPGPVEP